MQRRNVQILLLICGLLLVALVDHRGRATSRHAEEASAASQPPSRVDPGILGSLPDSTLIAVEIRNLAARWEEIRSIGPLACFQDELLAYFGLEASEVPRWIGNQAVVALVTHEDGRFLHPVIALQPDDPIAAESRIRGLAMWAASGSRKPATLRAGPWLWIAPAAEQHSLAAIVSGQVSGLFRQLPLDEIQQRLPGESLARGWIYPEGVRRWLRAQLPGTLPPPMEELGAILAAEFRELRYIAFRRHLERDRLVTEALAAYDSARLPAALAESLNPEAFPVPMPPSIPDGALLIAGFRLEPRTLRPWLERISLSDPDGPFRHLSFWIREFEAASRLSIDRHFADVLGEYGWFTLFRDPKTGRMEPVWMLETKDARTAENTLLRYRDWLVEHLRARSLGLTWPSLWSRPATWGTVHGASLSGQTAACFSNAGEYLLLGRSPKGLQAAFGLLGHRNSWVPAERSTQSSAPHAVAKLDPRLMAEALNGWFPFAEDSNLPAAVWRGIRRLLEDSITGSAGAWYENDALRFRGILRLE